MNTVLKVLAGLLAILGVCMIWGGSLFWLGYTGYEVFKLDEPFVSTFIINSLCWVGTVVMGWIFAVTGGVLVSK